MNKTAPLRSRLCLLALLLGAAIPAAEGPKITYIKSWPQANPAYIEIVVQKTGEGLYKEAADDEAPVKFRLTEKETAEIFVLAEKLDRFKRPLESNLKVARTGVKTFRYESGGEKNEVQFNYSLDESARLLWDWFERITETEQHLIRLERTAKFDRLGVNDALLRLQVSQERKRLVAKHQFLPVLKRIADNERYLHMARQRAASLAEPFKEEQ